MPAAKKKAKKPQKKTKKTGNNYGILINEK